MPKRIGIMTFHKAVSYGAGYQAYALQHYLTKLGYKAEIIDYIPPRFQKWNIIFSQPSNTNFIKKCIKFVPYTVCKSTGYYLLMRFNKKYLKLSEEKFFSEKELTSYDFEYDYYITGSDQVWNLKFDSLENIRPYLFSFTKKEAIRVSYAASIGMNQLSDIDLLKKREFIKWLKRYKAISVREKSAKELLDNEEIASEWVLDPTFLLNKSEWEKLALKPKKQKDRKFILVYGLYRNKQLYILANKIAKEKKYDIINVADSYDFCNNAKNDIIVTHEELLWYIKNAQCVITDSFHGVALSINFNRPIFIFKAARYNTRLDSLISLLELEYRYIDKLEDSELRELSMDYTNINHILDRERTKSRKYIQNALS